jgi:hypothetical protein
MKQTKGSMDSSMTWGALEPPKALNISPEWWKTHRKHSNLPMFTYNSSNGYAVYSHLGSLQWSKQPSDCKLPMFTYNSSNGDDTVTSR